MNIPSVPHCLFIPITIGFLQTNLYYETFNTPNEFLPYQSQGTIVNTQSITSNYSTPCIQIPLIHVSPVSKIKWNDNSIKSLLTFLKENKEVLKVLVKRRGGISDVIIKKEL
ncbi:10223_t:CDS:1 [Funneliformis mosseae]|uniref:10223_t:CDS:1 n=1 Tax=Funneliformis mosseae TaxID=27381 RepID=A0A9N9N653_FUNMO|nr:10223_t:CDS:1 [Funneliformis mosseae]